MSSFEEGTGTGGVRPTKEAVGDSIRMWREGLRDSAANTIRTT